MDIVYDVLAVFPAATIRQFSICKWKTVSSPEKYSGNHIAHGVSLLGQGCRVEVVGTAS